MQRKRKHLNWLDHLLNVNPYTDLTHVYYQTVIAKLIEICFPSKAVTRHTGDKPWITGGYRLLIRKRQRAHMRGA